ncbi:hypothetical protein Ciccas_010874 [Cichlidogyrus casuarinus]|uniref:Uncharacterized protein n=1 Tax=Cichlidogyrus casuarinus TaxID=1844966 RepID=A0ABD2PUW3_9PLAT
MAFLFSYVSNMNRFAPDNEMAIFRGSHRLKALELNGCPAWQRSWFNVFFKVYTGSEHLNCIFTSSVHLLDSTKDSAIRIRFPKDGLFLNGDVLLLAYTYERNPPTRTRLLK